MMIGEMLEQKDIMFVDFRTLQWGTYRQTVPYPAEAGMEHKEFTPGGMLAGLLGKKAQTHKPVRSTGPKKSVFIIESPHPDLPGAEKMLMCIYDGTGPLAEVLANTKDQSLSDVMDENARLRRELASWKNEAMKMGEGLAAGKASADLMTKSSHDDDKRDMADLLGKKRGSLLSKYLGGRGE